MAGLCPTLSGHLPLTGFPLGLTPVEGELPAAFGEREEETSTATHDLLAQPYANSSAACLSRANTFQFPPGSP